MQRHIGMDEPLVREFRRDGKSSDQGFDMAAMDTLSRHVAVAVIGLMLGGTPATAQEATADRSTVDLLLGGGLMTAARSPRPAVATGEVGVNAWVTRSFGVGLRQSTQYHLTQRERAYASLLMLNFRRQITPRAQFHFGWVPLARIAGTDHGRPWSAWSVVTPILDFFVDVEMPGRRFNVRGGVNTYVARGAWIHPMVLVVFPFP